MNGILQLLQDYNVAFQTEGHKHCRPGWANMPCPFCTGNPGLHLGVNLNTGHWYCWRCGYHPKIDTWAKLLRVDREEVSRILRDYKIRRRTRVTSKPVRINRRRLKLPSDCGPMRPGHRKYLIRRKFDPDKLEREWGLLGTGPVSRLDRTNYSRRILIPIHWDGKLVSFQTRDITGRSELKYLACSLEREKIPHKTILYGKQEAWNDTGICVEGVTDVWRLGPAAFAVFGIEYKPQQVRLIAKTFHRVAVVFDDDPQAVVQADKLVAELRFRGVDAWRVDIVGDPGDMDQDDADYLVREIVGKSRR